MCVKFRRPHMVFWSRGVNRSYLSHTSSVPDLTDKTRFSSYQHVVDYIDTQFESYLQEELKIKRSLHNYHDSRIHACLYFIAPSGHSLKSLDLVTMKKLDSKVGTKYMTDTGRAFGLIQCFNNGFWLSNWGGGAGGMPVNLIRLGIINEMID